MSEGARRAHRLGGALTAGEGLKPTSPLVWLGVVITLVFGYFAVRDVHAGEMWRALRTSDYGWLVPATVALALAIFLRAVRWRALFPAATRPPLLPVVRALLLGYFFNNLLPLRAGEAARVVALKREAGTSRAEASATVVIERVYDVGSLVALLFVALAWLPHLSWIGSASVVAAGLAVVVAAAVVVLALRRDSIVELAVRLATRMPYVPHERGTRAVRSLATGLAGLTHVRTAAVALAWTVASWFVMALSFWLVMLCFHFELSPMAGLLVVIATSLSLVLPSSPGAIGVFEAAVVLALDAYGIDRAHALSYALVLHALNFFPFLAAGAFVLSPAVGGRRSPSTVS